MWIKLRVGFCTVIESIQEDGLYPEGSGLSRGKGFIQVGVVGGPGRGDLLNTIEMLDLQPVLGRDQNDGQRELVYPEKRVGNGLKFRQSERVRRWEWFEGEMGISELDKGSLGLGRAAHLGEAYSQLTH